MNLRNKIVKLIVFLHIILFSNQQITTGIHKIIDGIQYAIVFDANEEYYNVICASHYYVFHKENNNLRTHGSLNFGNSPLLLFQDPENNYFVTTSNKLYSITLNINNEITKIEFVSDEITNFQIFGTISERMFSGYISISENIGSSLYEIISYGKEGENLYFFIGMNVNLKWLS